MLQAEHRCNRCIGWLTGVTDVEYSLAITATILSKGARRNLSTERARHLFVLHLADATQLLVQGFGVALRTPELREVVAMRAHANLCSTAHLLAFRTFTKPFALSTPRILVHEFLDLTTHGARLLSLVLHGLVCARILLLEARFTISVAPGLCRLWGLMFSFAPTIERFLWGRFACGDHVAHEEPRSQLLSERVVLALVSFGYREIFDL